MNVREEILKVKYWITHNLTRSMIGDIPAAVYSMICCRDRWQILLIHKEVVFLARLANCKDVRMLAEYEIIIRNSLLVFWQMSIARFDRQRPIEVDCLIFPGIFVVDQPQVNKLQFLISDEIQLSMMLD